MLGQSPHRLPTIRLRQEWGSSRRARQKATEGWTPLPIRSLVSRLHRSQVRQPYWLRQDLAQASSLILQVLVWQDSIAAKVHQPRLIQVCPHLRLIMLTIAGHPLVDLSLREHLVGHPRLHQCLLSRLACPPHTTCLFEQHLLGRKALFVLFLDVVVRL